jgi:hypothetical protein
MSWHDIRWARPILRISRKPESPPMNFAHQKSHVFYHVKSIISHGKPPISHGKIPWRIRRSWHLGPRSMVDVVPRDDDSDEHGPRELEKSEGRIWSNRMVSNETGAQHFWTALKSGISGQVDLEGRRAKRMHT